MPLIFVMAVLAFLWRTLLGRVGTGPDGGVPAYHASGTSTTPGAATDIWGLGDQAQSPIAIGTYQDPYSTRRGGPAFERANEIPSAFGDYGTNPYSGKPIQSGMNYASATDMMADLPKLYAQDKAAYIALQQKLYDAGFYGSASPQSIGLGAYGQQTINAYRDAVRAAVQLNQAGNPITFEELLAQKDPAAAGRKKQAGRKAIVPGFVAQYSDPETVAAIAQRAAQTALGRNLSTAEVTAYVKEFHAAEQKWNANQKATDLTAAAGKDVAQTSAPDAAATAEQFAQRGSRGVEASGNKLADYVNTLRNMVGGTGV